MLKHLNDKTLLYLEDDEETLLNAGKIFSYIVHTVHTCNSITEAQHILNNYKIDIIVSDILLQGELAIPFIEEVRKCNTFIPIIIVSGYSNEELLLRMIPLKLTAYMRKPIQYDHLLDALTLCSHELSIQPKQNIELNDGWSYNSERKALLRQGNLYSLTQQESRFVELLVHNKNGLISKDMIRDYVWNEDDVTEQMIANLLARIRKRFGKSFIYTIRDLGYRLKR